MGKNEISEWISQLDESEYVSLAQTDAKRRENEEKKRLVGKNESCSRRFHYVQFFSLNQNMYLSRGFDQIWRNADRKKDSIYGVQLSIDENRISDRIFQNFGSMMLNSTDIDAVFHAESEYLSQVQFQSSLEDDIWKKRVPHKRTKKKKWPKSQSNHCTVVSASAMYRIFRIRINSYLTWK